MANKEHNTILKQGKEAWNSWRKEYPAIVPDLSHLSLDELRLDRYNLSGCNLEQASLRYTSLRVTNLSRANLNKTDIYYTDFFWSNLWQATFQNSNIVGAYLSSADAREVDFKNAQMRYATITDTLLTDTDFTGTKLSETSFSNVDLSSSKGLDQVAHEGPCTIGVDSLYKSGGKIPEVFLRGCGVPDKLVEQLPVFTDSRNLVKYYSCFISYSAKDEDFAKRLYSKLREAQLRVWFAPEDIKAGQKIFEQVESAIQKNDKLLLILSEESMRSEWVLTELRRALAAEKKENRKKLFPIRLVDFDTLKAWHLIDSDSGKDLAEEIRSYFIPDFSNWQDDQVFEVEFSRLLMNLRAEEYLSLNAPLRIKELEEYVQNKTNNLTGREIQFLKLACTDLSYHEIAKAMYLSPRTVEGYRDALFEKLNVKTRVGLVLYALKNGMVPN